MAMEDSADYQLAELATSLNELNERIDRSSAAQGFKNGYQQAVEDIADRMGIKTKRTFYY